MVAAWQFSIVYTTLQSAFPVSRCHKLVSVQSVAVVESLKTMARLLTLLFARSDCFALRPFICQLSPSEQFDMYFFFQKRDESGVNSSCRERNLRFLLASSFYWNHVFNVHQWLVSILWQFLYYHHCAGYAKQRLQPIYLHSDIPPVQESV